MDTPVEPYQRALHRLSVLQRTIPSHQNREPSASVSSLPASTGVPFQKSDVNLTSSPAAGSDMASVVMPPEVACAPEPGSSMTSASGSQASAGDPTDTVQNGAEVAVVIGAGNGLGAAVARRFARAGYTVCVARRNPEKLGGLVQSIEAAGGRAVGLGLDARSEPAVRAFFRQVEAQHGPVAVCVFNVGANVRFSVLDTTERVYRKVWEMAALGAFLVGREAARVMLERRRGTILFTGATASLRGAAGFCAFSGAKSAKRALAQSMARELGPQGIHVAHVVVDGPIDGAFIRSVAPGLVEEHENPARGPRLLDPAAIADTFYAIHSQPRSAWTFETDLRPWTEPW